MNHPDHIDFNPAIGETVRLSALRDVRQFQKLLHQLQSGTSYHPETTHQLRKLTRRCSAAWQVLYRCHAVKHPRNVLQFWRSLRHLLGPLRDADIRLESFHDFFPIPTAHQKQLLGNLEQSWLIQFKKVSTELQSNVSYAQSLTTNLFKALDNTSLQYRWSKKSQRWLARRINEWQKLAAQSLKNPDRLHTFRICTKKLRYQFQCLTLCLPKRSTWLDDLESLQDELGYHRDLLNTLVWIKETKQLIKLHPTSNHHLQKDLQRWQKHSEQQARNAFSIIKQKLRRIAETSPG